MKSYIINYIIKGLIILFITSIIPATLYLVKQQQILKSKASLEQSVVFFGEGVSEKDGQYIATQLTGIRVKLTSPIIQPINEAEPLSMDCPQNSTVNPGGQIPVTVFMKNTGNTVWDTNYRLGFLDGTDPNNTDKGDTLSKLFGTYHLPLTSAVKPQDQTTISLTLTAPQQTGNYVVQWQMLKESVGWFGGKSKQCSFTVSKVTATPPPTLPPTPAPTPTPGPAIPADPTNLSVNCPTPGTAANLSWNKVTGADTYTIWAFDHVPGSSDWASCTQGPNICGYTVEGTNANNLPTWAGVKYRWYVFACNSAGCSPNGADSQKICDSVPAATPTPIPTPVPTPVPTPTPAQPVTSAYTPKGFLDTADCNFINGWACDADNYNARLDIHFYDGQPGAGGKFIGNITANTQRESGVGDQCGGNSNHGFFFAVPDSVKDGQNHNIYAYAINYPTNEGNPLLSGAPKTISCGSVQGIAKAAEHPYTASFKVAKSPEDLEKADPKDYDADPKYIDYTFSGNPTPGTTETLYVEFIGQGGEKETRQVTITYRPTVMVTPSPDPGNFQKQVWFTPNLGSADMLDLFRNPDQWSNARSKINVFKFFTPQLTSNYYECPEKECGENNLQNLIKVGAFSKLKQWGIDIAIESPSAWWCDKNQDGDPDAENMSKRDKATIQNVLSNGGNVRYIAMDEPRYHGTRPDLCKFTEEQIVKRTVNYITKMKADYPQISIGDIEPYPARSADELEKWISLLEQNNIKLAFFDLDIDPNLAKTQGRDLRGDLKRLKQAAESRGIPFGVIFVGLTGANDKVYFDEVMNNISTYKDILGAPTRSVFQSFIYNSSANRFNIPTNLPENNYNIFSHTRLLNEGYQVLNGGSASTPTPIPTPVSGDKQVWFTPNLGSTDMLDLFRNFDQWTSARSKINVFKFYSQQVTLTDPSQCSQCGQNLLPNLINAGAFSKLTNSGVGIAFEAGVLKPGNCATADGNNKPVAFTTVSMNGINNIQSNGGIVRYIAMDEPYIGGTGNPGNGQNPCKLTMEQSAFRTAQYRNLVKQAYPGVEIGDIEPYPYFSADELKKWISEFKKYNIKLAFFHLDIDMALVKTWGKNLAADLQDLQAFTENQGIPFGVIFIGNWPDESQISNQVYYESTLTNVRTVKSAIGIPTHSIFQSWWEYPSGVNQLPINLPENNSDIYSHTRLLNEGYQILSPNQSSAVEANSEKPNPVIEIIQSIPLVGALFSTPEPTSQPTPYPTPSHTPSFIPVAVSTPVPTPSVQTDFNSDSKVNAVDLSILFSSWGKKNSKTDINSDGIVNSLDYTLFLRSYRH